MKRLKVGKGVPLRVRVLVAAASIAAVALAVPAVSSAMGSSVWVSPAPVKGPFTSCSTPGYNSIQEAINIAPANSTIHVCAGTYSEQVLLQKADTISGEIGATLALPASPVNTKSACDNEPENEQDLFMVCTGGKVKISGLTLDGDWAAGTCNDDLYALNAGGGVKLTLLNSTVEAAGAVPANGCQGGVGIQIGRQYTGQTATAKLTDDTVKGYQKNGITVDNTGSSAKLSGVTVKGEPSSEIATNGIQVSRGAKAKITNSQIEGNECNVAGHCSDNPEYNEDATGILFYDAASGSAVKNTTLVGNDYGIYNYLGSETAKTTISGDTFRENRYWGLTLDQGNATVNNDTFTGPGGVGIQIVQYNGQEFGAHGTGRSDSISGMNCAVEGWSDNNPSDHPASLTLTNSVSKFTGNAQELCNNNTTGTLVIKLS